MPRSPEANRAQTARWRAANPERDREIRRRATLKHRYGLTPEEYDGLMEKPCAVCSGDSDHLDHSHTTGKVRAPLCSGCNHGIGHFADSPVLLRRAAAYLEEHAP